MKPLYAHLPRFCLAIFILINSYNSGAQFVTIPDVRFVTWLNANGFSGCMSGNQLDTTCTTVLNTHGLYCSSVPIHNLTGVQYFKNLDTLECYYDSLTLMPALPGSLQYLDCSNNQLNSVHPFPSTLTYLACQNNVLLSLPVLPAGVTQLNCGFNLLNSLPVLPSGLTLLYCNYNNLSGLPTLPVALVNLDCSSNQLTSLSALPNTLRLLICEINQISTLPSLNPGLVTLNCNGNILYSLPSLPSSLQTLQCDGNKLGVLPLLPDGLITLSCNSDSLGTLPPLPPGLHYLDCGNNNITALPLLPANLTTLNCNQNLLTFLPELPDSLYHFNCFYNQYLSCLPELKRIVNFQFNNCAVTCLPNYGKVTNSTPALSTLPLCNFFNPGGCGVYSDISGRVFSDFNGNCAFDDTDKPEHNVKVELLRNGAVLKQAYTDANGDYSFQAPYGSYSLRIDTSNFPLKDVCPLSGSISETLNATDSLSFGNNFSFECSPGGYDIGVTSIVHNSASVTPGSHITVNTVCGDISALYGAHCAAGTTGQVQISFFGPVTYVGPAAGALTPSSTTGGMLTYSIPDFGSVNNYTDFNIVMQVNANALAGQQIIVSVNVLPGPLDFNPDNNLLTLSFPVTGASAANTKEVSPYGQIYNFSQWLTYTIHFTNTGSDTAKNIFIADTLDANLVASSFDLLNASAKNLTQLSGNVVMFSFPNINLPPLSSAGDSASSGFVQYRVQTISSIYPGLLINNTANIYFNLTNLIATNTVTDTVVSSQAVQQLTVDDFGLHLFPNPTNNQLNIEITQPGKYTIRVLDVARKLLYSATTQSVNNVINVSAFACGIYLTEIVNGENTERVRWVKM